MEHKFSRVLFFVLFLAFPVGTAFADEAKPFLPCRDKSGPCLFNFEEYKPIYAIFQDGSEDPHDGLRQYIKFQISFKQNLGVEGLFFAYTQKSFWSVTGDSMPFKDSNYNPEFFFAWMPDKERMLHLGQAGVEHESNGRGEEYDKSGKPWQASRSWNRVYWEPKMTLGDFTVSLKGWAILAGIEDNKDVADYYGNGELGASYVTGRAQLAVKMRKGIKAEYGSFQTEFMYRPFNSNIGIYFQYWDGYGESLLDYNRRTSRYGIGLSISDLLP